MRLLPLFKARVPRPLSVRSDAPDASEAGSPSPLVGDRTLFQKPGASLPAPSGRVLGRWPLELAEYFCALVAAHHLGNDRCVRAAADVLARRESRRQAEERQREMRQYRVRRARRYEPLD